VLSILLRLKKRRFRGRRWGDSVYPSDICHPSMDLTNRKFYKLINMVVFMTFQEFRRSARDNPQIRRAVFDYQDSQGNYNGNFIDFEQDFTNHPQGLEHLFTTYYTGNQRVADRMARGANRGQNNTPRRIGIPSVFENGNFVKSLVMTGIGVGMLVTGPYLSEQDLPLRAIGNGFELGASAVIGLGSVMTFLSGINHYISRR